MRCMPKARRSQRVSCRYGIHATFDRMNATRARALPIPRRMLPILGTVHAIRRGMSLTPRTVNATGDRMHGAARRIVLGWRTNNAIAGRIGAGSVRREP
jgi:hypothetical protein